MHGVYIRALMLSFVLVSGMFILSVGVEDAFANKGGVKGGQGEPKSCDKDTKKNPGKNPNCAADDTDFDKDGLTDQEEIDLAAEFPDTLGCLDPFHPDSDGDGVLDGADAFPCDPDRS